MNAPSLCLNSKMGFPSEPEVDVDVKGGSRRRASSRPSSPDATSQRSGQNVSQNEKLRSSRWMDHGGLRMIVPGGMTLRAGKDACQRHFSSTHMEPATTGGPLCGT